MDVLFNKSCLLHEKGNRGINNNKRFALVHSAELFSNSIKINEGFREREYSGSPVDVYVTEYKKGGDYFVARFLVINGEITE